MHTNFGSYGFQEKRPIGRLENTGEGNIKTGDIKCGLD
jgi:hypothetical protein